MKRLIFALVALVVADTVAAHSLKAFASNEGENVRIKSFFYGNSPCIECDVKISANGALIEQIKTDKSGIATTKLPEGEYEIEIYAGSGHGKKINFKVENVNASEKPAQNFLKTREANVSQTAPTAILSQSDDTQSDEKEKEGNLLNFALSFVIIFGIFGALYAIKKRK